MKNGGNDKGEREGRWKWGKPRGAEKGEDEGEEEREKRKREWKDDDRKTEGEGGKTTKEGRKREAGMTTRRGGREEEVTEEGEKYNIRNDWLHSVAADNGGGGEMGRLVSWWPWFSSS